MPFFLHALLQRSLAEVDWHLLAAKILNVVPIATCRCASLSAEDLAPAQAELLQELLAGVSHALIQTGQHVAEPLRAQVLFLADLCRQAGGVLRGNETSPAEGASRAASEDLEQLALELMPDVDPEFKKSDEIL